MTLCHLLVIKYTIVWKYCYKLDQQNAHTFKVMIFNLQNSYMFDYNIITVNMCAFCWYNL